MDILGPAHGSESLTSRAQPKHRACVRRGYPTHFRNHVLRFVTPTDKASSCVCGSAASCRLERTSRAIAGARRLLRCQSSQTAKFWYGTRVPGFQSALRFVEQFWYMLQTLILAESRLLILFIPSLKLVHFVLQQTQVTNFCGLEAGNRIPSVGCSTQKGTVSLLLLVVSTRFAVSSLIACCSE